MCGIVVESEQDRVLSIRGDDDDPFSRGHVCPKAVALKDLHEDGDRLRVDYFGQPTYVFPRRDCALLPIQNSTAEMLAQYLGQRVRDELNRAGHTHLTLLELEVEENYGQAATYRETLGD